MIAPPIASVSSASVAASRVVVPLTEVRASSPVTPANADGSCNAPPRTTIPIETNGDVCRGLITNRAPFTSS